MHAITPAGSVHALPVDALEQPEVTFWTLWVGDELLGCGALKALDGQTGEIKSMRTANHARRLGVGERVLLHVEAEARRRGYTRLYLETGATDAFAPARALYAKHAYVACGPFADYTDDPHSAFMTKTL